jgi:hypothetical protein
MDSVTPTSVVAVLCCFVLPIVGFIVWSFVAPTPDNILNWMFWKSVKQESDDEKEYRNDLIRRGVTAPARILSLRGLGHTQKLDGGPYKARVEYEVEVMPEGQPAFRSVLQHWLPMRDKHDTGWAIEEEQHKKIWVTYDPNNPSDIVYSHNETNHEQVLSVRQFVNKRNHFIDMEKEGIRIREMGVETLAVILEVEELGVETPEEKKEGRAFRLKLHVTPHNGTGFESETYAMVSLDTMHKLTVGKMVHVKFDALKPEISALIRTAE